MTEKKYRNALPAGTSVGGFCIEKVLGQGGFGITYLARDMKLERLVAVKEYFPMEFSSRESNGMVVPQAVDDDQVYAWGKQRFLDEGKTLAKFKHPNIVRVIDYIEENNTAYILMEFEHGSDLQTILKEKKALTHDEILNIFLPLLDGLSQVHKAGFIHRDIKPANIFIREDGSPVLIDFGSARQGISPKTRTMTTLVSPGYAPFEQYNSSGAGKQGPWTDIYALGASMYRSLFGRSPADAVSRAEERVAGRIDPYMRAIEIGSGYYPVEILEAIDSALAFLPDERPQTVDEWIPFMKAGAVETSFGADEEETMKIETAIRQEHLAVSKSIDRTRKSSATGLRLAVTGYIVIGMLTLWAYTSYMLSYHLAEYAKETKGLHFNHKMQYVFSGVYVVTLMLVLFWVFPNLFLKLNFNEKFFLNLVLLSAVLFYINTVAFVLWIMKQIKSLDNMALDELVKHQVIKDEEVRKFRNNMISKWEVINNHVVLFLLISLPMIFSAYVGAKLFFSSQSPYLVKSLPFVVMFLGGIFHIWGTRLLINTYNNIIVKI